MAVYADNRRHTKPCNLQPGDQVLIKQKRLTKLTPPFSPDPYEITARKGSMLTARRGDHTITRNSSHFKKMKREPDTQLLEPEPDPDPYVQATPPDDIEVLSPPRTPTADLAVPGSPPAEMSSTPALDPARPVAPAPTPMASARPSRTTQAPKWHNDYHMK